MILNHPLRCLEIFLSLGKTLGPQEGPPRTHRGSPRGPERVSGEPNDIRHVGYQFYSIFSTENKYRVKAPLKFQIRLPQSDPWGSRVSLGGSSKNLMMQGMLGNNSTQISALKTNTRSTHLLDFESDSHRVAHGGPCV